MTDDVLEPPPDLVMCVDRHNTAHVLLPRVERGALYDVTLCGGPRPVMLDDDLLDLLSAPWSLLTDRQYRAWPPWPCQTCVSRTLATLPISRPGTADGSESLPLWLATALLRRRRGANGR